MNQSIKNAGLIVVGCVLMAASFNLFFDPFHISPGGVSGLAMIISYFSGTGAGFWVALLNLPLAILAYIKLGWKIIASTLVSIALFSALIDLFAWMPAPVDDLMLAALCGGVLTGLAVGLIFRAGATTGGTTIAGKVVLLYKPHLRMGLVLLSLDGAVVAVTAIVFRNFALAIYAFIAMFVSSKIIDAVLYGFDYATLVYVISEKHHEIGLLIQARLERGVTYLEAQGGYTEKPTRIVLCAIKRGQLTALRAAVKEHDPAAFLIVTEGHQIFGSGFSPRS